MGKGRLEAFSDGVMAIIITIMVLELKVPHHGDLHALLELAPVFLGYVLSFAYVGIYWNNHHHLVHTVKRVSAGVMWANLNLLFWLSLLPFATGWAGEHVSESWPAALYGVILLLAAMAYLILQKTIARSGGVLEKALGNDIKGKVSPLLYAAGIGLAWVRPWISQILYAVVALIWIIPDRRIEKELAEE